MFVPGTSYRRKTIHDKYGGQPQYGISTPAALPIILLFSSETGEKYGYKDGWESPDLYLYTGEGQVGDMEFTRGNLAIRNHTRDGKELHLFEDLGGGNVRYMGEMIYLGHRFRQAPDREGNTRRAIVFELTPLKGGLIQADSQEPPRADLPMGELHRRALEAARETAPIEERRANLRQRSRAIRDYVLRRGNGICESCGKPAPFQRPDGAPFLETHHVRRLSDGGPDDPEWVAAVCPNCHREAHHGERAREVNQRLRNNILAKEASR